MDGKEFVRKVKLNAKNSKVAEEILQQYHTKLTSRYVTNKYQALYNIMPCESEEIETALSVIEKELINYCVSLTYEDLTDRANSESYEWMCRVELMQRDFLDSIEEANEEAEA